MYHNLGLQATMDQPGVRQIQFGKALQHGSLQRVLHTALRQAVRGGRRAYMTLPMDAQTCAMFWLFSAATHMRPVSVPYTPNSLRRRTIWSLVRPE